MSLRWQNATLDPLLWFSIHNIIAVNSMDYPILSPAEASFSIESFLNQPLRTERLIAGARVSLALVFLLALLIDPSEPAQYARFVLSLTSVYFFLSIGLLVWLKLHDHLPAALPIWVQATE